jgi:putative polyketide hydroxylase
VFFSGPDSEAWHEASRKGSETRNFDLESYRIGSGGNLHDVENAWTSTYGVKSDGAILVRPDGFIAWRSRHAVEAPNVVLSDVFHRLSLRDAQPSKQYKTA